MGKKQKRIPILILDMCELGILNDSLWRLHIELWLFCDDGGLLPSEEICCRRLRRDTEQTYPLFTQLIKRGLLVCAPDGALIHRMARAQYERRRARARKPGYGPDWHKVRWDILMRDSQICQYCGAYADHVDHVIPVVQGGTNDPDNLVAACGPCNMSKGGRTPEQAGMILRPEPTRS